MHLTTWVVIGLLVLGTMAVGGQAAGPTDPTAKNFVAALALVPTTIPDSPKEFVLKAGQTVVAIGDSITAGGGYMRDSDVVLAREYPDLKLPKIVNKGIGGQKAEDLVGRFKNDVVALKPAVVTLSIGINDVWHRVGQPHSEAVLKAYGDNLAKMVDMAQAADIRVILLAPTVIEESPTSEGNKRLPMYVAAMKQVAADKKCQFVDLHAMFLAALAKKPTDAKGNWLTADGVHMKPLGDAIMAIGVLRALGVPDAKIGAGVATSQRGNEAT
jgi:lysophospholipase L1-like esterase